MMTRFHETIDTLRLERDEAQAEIVRLKQEIDRLTTPTGCAGVGRRGMMTEEETELMRRATGIYERGHYFPGEKSATREQIIAEIYKGLLAVHRGDSEPNGTMIARRNAMTDAERQGRE